MKKIRTNERIKKLREGAGLSQEEVAKKLGMSKKAYTRYESGKRSLTMRAAIALATLYDVSLDSMDLISDIDFTYRLKGTNFTPSSQVKLNGEWIDTVYVNPTTLMISGTELKDFDRISVSQRSNSSTRKALSKSYDRSVYMLYSENKWKLPTDES